MKQSFAIALAAALIAGCRGQEIVCPLLLSPGVAVEVRDAFSGATIASGAKLVAQAGSYADSMSFPAGQPDFNDSHLRGAYQPGVYTLTVTKTGYQPWVQANVIVTAAQCGVNLTSLTATLHAAP
ncbi:MAG TPA: carboxypeptidase-like regulatory domain-containing protein [Gemmatimonadaceae bacterium]|nr:carboxypeptidase-like regulatory domain-containing protein [Gemmatimonadaceae bacterium]